MIIILPPSISLLIEFYFPDRGLETFLTLHLTPLQVGSCLTLETTKEETSKGQPGLETTGTGPGVSG